MERSKSTRSAERMEDIKITSSKLKALNDFSLSQKSSDIIKANCWYYTSLDTANLILKNKEVWISSIKNMNDRDESDLHKSDGEMIHCFCFCNSNSEKIPMWYLTTPTAARARRGIRPKRRAKR